MATTPAYFALQQNGQIVNGPSKFDLMLALFDSTVRNPRMVKFSLESKVVISCWIQMVEMEDGSGESWNFKGRADFNNPSLNCAIEGYYSTQERTGTMKLTGKR